jgi:hypothetical protein
MVFCTAMTATIAVMRRDLISMVKKSLCDLGEGRKEVIGWRRRETSGFGAVGLVERQNFTLGGQTALSYTQAVE